MSQNLARINTNNFFNKAGTFRLLMFFKHWRAAEQTQTFQELFYNILFKMSCRTFFFPFQTHTHTYTSIPVCILENTKKKIDGRKKFFITFIYCSFIFLSSLLPFKKDACATKLFPIVSFVCISCVTKLNKRFKHLPPCALFFPSVPQFTFFVTTNLKDHVAKLTQCLACLSVL